MNQEIDARDLDRVIHSSLNGQGKIRSDRTGQARTPQSWRVALFSTGEYSIRARLAEAGIMIKTGQELRLVDLPVIDEKFGIFSKLPDKIDGATFANQLRSAASQSYGHAGPAIVQAILDRDTESLRELHEKIRTCFSTSNAQEGRVADMFATVARAGEIAAYDDIVPWNPSTSQDFGDSDRSMLPSHSLTVGKRLARRQENSVASTATSFRLSAIIGSDTFQAVSWISMRRLQSLPPVTRSHYRLFKT